MSVLGSDTRLPGSLSLRWLAGALVIALGEPTSALLDEHLGFGGTALVSVAAIVIIAIAYLARRLPSVVAACLTVVLTPIFAISAADYLAQPTARGGIGLGDAATTVLMSGLLLLLVCVRTLTRRDAAETATTQ